MRSSEFNKITPMISLLDKCFQQKRNQKLLAHRKTMCVYFKAGLLVFFPFSFLPFFLYRRLEVAGSFFLLEEGEHVVPLHKSRLELKLKIPERRAKIKRGRTPTKKSKEKSNAVVCLWNGGREGTARVLRFGSNVFKLLTQNKI